VVYATSLPFTPGENPVPIVQETGLAPGPSGRVRKISPRPGFDPWIFQPLARPTCIVYLELYLIKLKAATRTCGYTHDGGILEGVYKHQMADHWSNGVLLCWSPGCMDPPQYGTGFTSPVWRPIIIRWFPDFGDNLWTRSCGHLAKKAGRMFVPKEGRRVGFCSEVGCFTLAVIPCLQFGPRSLR
jgi:hypothetical protein